LDLEAQHKATLENETWNGNRSLRKLYVRCYKTQDAKWNKFKLQYFPVCCVL